MSELHARLEKATDSGRFVRANIQWHLAVARAGHNPLLAAIYQVIGPDLLTPRVEGFADRDVRTASIRAERLVLEAIVAGDAPLARRRMEKHIVAYNDRQRLIAE